MCFVEVAGEDQFRILNDGKSSALSDIHSEIKDYESPPIKDLILSSCEVLMFVSLE